MTKLTEHFTLEELTITTHRFIDNTPPREVIFNLQQLADYLEDIREILNSPIIISSGYRSPELNSVIGGVKNSTHLDGRAADFICPGFGDPYEICKAISQSGIDFDQLILELNRWVHFGIAKHNEKPRRELLTLVGPNAYVHGLIKK